MMTALFVLIGLLALVGLGYLLLEKRPGYGAYYGVAKLSGAKLDIGPVDFATLTRRRSGNDALVCPPGHCPAAASDWDAKTYAMGPDRLIGRIKTIALAEPRTRLIDGAAESARFVQYSRLMRFPDTIDVQAFPAGAGQSTLAVYSRSLVGSRDFGVNRARVARWLAALERT